MREPERPRHHLYTDSVPYLTAILGPAGHIHSRNTDLLELHHRRGTLNCETKYVAVSVSSQDTLTILKNLLPPQFLQQPEVLMGITISNEAIVGHSQGKSMTGLSLRLSKVNKFPKSARLS